VKAYRKAYHLSRDLSVYQGLVAAHLLNAQPPPPPPTDPPQPRCSPSLGRPVGGGGRPLDASLMANEAVDLYPGQPLALVLPTPRPGGRLRDPPSER